MKVLTGPRLIGLIAAVALSVGSCDQPSNSQSRRFVGGSTPSVALSGRVTDAAQVLSPEQEARLTAKLENLEQTTKHQVVVATVSSLGGQDVATFTRNLANSWGIGRKSHNDGVVLLIAPNERKARIAVGYGLEEELPDALCQQIMTNQIIPRVREGDLAGGVEAGVDALAAQLNS